MLMPTLPLILTVSLSLLYAFLNGYNDSGANIAPLVASRAMERRPALLLAAFAELIGPFLFGLAVAETVGRAVIRPELITALELNAALVAAVGWGVLAERLGIPTSATHALLGGLVGAAFAGVGLDALNLVGIGRIVIFLVMTPIAGLVLGHLTLSLVLRLAQATRPSINDWFRLGEIGFSLGLSLVHGANNAQKSIGLITMGLVIGGELSGFDVPFWVVAVSATALALGAAVSSQGIMRRVGGHLYRVRPVHGFAATGASFVTLLIATEAGAPISGTQVISATLAGAGAAQRLSMVRWTVFQSIVVAWVITFPVTTALAAAVVWGVRFFQLTP